MTDVYTRIPVIPYEALTKTEHEELLALVGKISDAVDAKNIPSVVRHHARVGELSALGFLRSLLLDTQAIQPRTEEESGETKIVGFTLDKFFFDPPPVDEEAGEVDLRFPDFVGGAQVLQEMIDGSLSPSFTDVVTLLLSMAPLGLNYRIDLLRKVGTYNDEEDEENHTSPTLQ
jgi:hypothetical protein